MEKLLAVSEIKETFKKINGPEKKYGEFEFCTLIGSHMYGLETSESDLDILIVTSGKRKGYFNQTVENDYRIDTAHEILNRAWSSTPEDIDLIQSIKCSNLQSNFTPMFRGFNPNINQYLENLEKRMLVDLKRVYRDNFSEIRRSKTLKVTARNLFLHRKVLEKGISFNPRFTPLERDSFYKFYENIEAYIEKSETAEDALRTLFRKLEDF